MLGKPYSGGEIMHKKGSGHESLFERLFGGSSRDAREDRVREYIVHRVHHGACLSDVLQEEYVRRNCNRDEVNEIVRDPRLIQREREELESFFADGRFDPRRR